MDSISILESDFMLRPRLRNLNDCLTREFRLASTMWRMLLWKHCWVHTHPDWDSKYIFHNDMRAILDINSPILFCSWGGLVFISGLIWIRNVMTVLCSVLCWAILSENTNYYQRQVFFTIPKCHIVVVVVVGSSFKNYPRPSPVPC